MAVTEDRTGRLQKIKWTWTCTSAGTYSEASTYQYNGQIVELITDPGATAPTDDYDITIVDSDGYDVLAGQGLNRDTANTEFKLSGDKLGYVKSSTLTLTIAAAGDAATGITIVYVYDLDKGVIG